MGDNLVQKPSCYRANGALALFQKSQTSLLCFFVGILVSSLVFPSFLHASCAAEDDWIYSADSATCLDLQGQLYSYRGPRKTSPNLGFMGHGYASYYLSPLISGHSYLYWNLPELGAKESVNRTRNGYESHSLFLQLGNLDSSLAAISLGRFPSILLFGTEMLAPFSIPEKNSPELQQTEGSKLVLEGPQDVMLEFFAGRQSDDRLPHYDIRASRYLSLLYGTRLAAFFGSSEKKRRERAGIGALIFGERSVTSIDLVRYFVNDRSHFKQTFFLFNSYRFGENIAWFDTKYTNNSEYSVTLGYQNSVSKLMDGFLSGSYKQSLTSVNNPQFLFVFGFSLNGSFSKTGRGSLELNN